MKGLDYFSGFQRVIDYDLSQWYNILRKQSIEVTKALSYLQDDIDCLFCHEHFENRKLVAIHLQKKHFYESGRYWVSNCLQKTKSELDYEIKFTRTGELKK